MNDLRPNGFDLWLRYRCDCGVDHFLSLEQAKAGFVLVCDVCKKIHRVKKISRARVGIDFACNSKSKKIANICDGIIDGAYKHLKEYGYSKKEIAYFQEQLKATNSTDLVKEFLATR